MENLVNPFSGVFFSSLMKANDDKAMHTINSFPYTSAELIQQGSPSFYICEVMQLHKKSKGLIAALSMSFLNKRILPHENTFYTKTFQYREDFNRLRMQFNPVLLLHKDLSEINLLLDTYTQKKCDIQLNLPNTIYKIWIIYDKLSINKICYNYNKIASLFIADGHHRLASLSELEQTKRVMAFLLSENNIFNYNICRTYEDLKEVELILGSLFKTYSLIKVFSLHNNHEKNISLVLNNNFYLLKYKKKFQIDSYVNSSHFLFNILEKLNPLEKSMTFSNFPWYCLEEIIPNLLKKNKSSLKFLVPSMSLDYLFYIINKGEVLPPHSTWFGPKLPNKLISFILD